MRSRAPEHPGSLRSRPAAAAASPWALQCHVAGNGGVQRTPLRPLPFRIGRAAACSLVLSSSHVSKHHAEIYSDGLALRIRDLGSRNGTFLNRQPVTDAPLHEHDVLHIGDHEFRVVARRPEEDCRPTRCRCEPALGRCGCAS